MAYKNLLTLHNEHRHWLNEFDLYQDEIKYFQHQLAKKISQLQNQELEKDAHYFKTQWLQILSTIDDFRHKVYAHEARLYRKLELANRTKDHVITDEEHHTVKSEMEEFSLQYKSTKQRFQEFIMS